MSVEKQSVESTAEAVKPVDDQKANTVSDGASLESAISDTNSKADDSNTTADGTPVENTEILPEEISASRARAWFEQLDASERATNLSFVDGPFLGAFLAFSSWSPVRSGLEGASAENEFIELDNMVVIEEFESRLQDYMDMQAPSYGQKGGMNNGSSGDEAGVAKPAESDALRIRTQSGGGVEMLQKGVESPSAENGPSFDLLRGVVAQMSVTFPSALRHVTGRLVDEQFPLVSLHPSALEKIRDEDFFHALDAISLHFFGDRFLGRDAFQGDTFDSWFLSKLRRRKLLPLGALLFARLECSAMESFLSVQSKESEAKDDSISEMNSASHAAEFSRYGNATSKAELESVPSVELVLSKVTELSLSRETANTEANVLKDILSPFFSAFHAEKYEMSTIDNLLLTPLHFLGKISENTSEIDFLSLDNGVGFALQRLDEHHASQQKPTPPVNSEKTEVSPAEPKASIATDQSNQAFTHKKKKRKYRKRKKKQAAGKSSHHAPVGAKEPELAPQRNSAPGPKKPDQERRKSGQQVKPEHDEPQKPQGRVPAAVQPTTVAASKSDHSAAIHDEKSEVQVTEVGADLKKAGYVSHGGEAGKHEAVPGSPKQSYSPRLSPSSPRHDSATNHTKGEHADEGDVWETVEVRARGGRKKSGGHGSSRHASFNNDNHGKKTKGARTPASRKKIANRKIAKDILSSILDKVDDQVRRKKPVAAGPVVNPWKVGIAAAKTVSSIGMGGDEGEKATAKNEKTLRDVVLGGTKSPKKAAVGDGALPKGRFPSSEPKLSPKRDRALRSHSSPTHRSKGTAADQNTAPTYQETISAVSTPSNGADPKERRKDSVERNSKTSSSSDDTEEEVPQNTTQAVSRQTKKENPPLPTLLSPENANSANSSVASSLEVPHSSRLHHHSNCTVDVNDVGYHLLDVCDRLSRDMSLFMSRRALALSSRRRERGALLAALQNTVSGMWPGQCHVEMYGSCATQLDLPSSDIDVVVVGLDRSMEMMMAPQSQQTLRSNSGGSKSISTGNLRASKSMEEPTVVDESQHTQISRHHSYVQMPMHMNGERVRRLAVELETQPWAVRVNAIPTASVPVVKVLCDPSRLTGTSNGGDWMVNHEQMASQAAAAAGQGEQAAVEENGQSSPPFHSQQLPWRGSDVMNGLLSLDITFEGPEHGGIGSTEFSARVVSEACQEAGLHPDATPFVQVVMVLKELLGQRKLNEPYSGGLSSYALLLLVVGLLRERAVIREELERVEKQRRAMVSGDGGSSFVNSGGPQGVAYCGPSGDSDKALERSSRATVGKKEGGSAQQGDLVSERKAVSDTQKEFSTTKSGQGRIPLSMKEVAAPKKTSRSATSSWASVAKKQTASRSNSSVSQGNAGEQPVNVKQSQLKGKPVVANKPSFADAVAKSAPGTTTSTDRKEIAKKRSESKREDKATTAKVSTKPQVPKTQQVMNEAFSAAEPTSSMDPQLIPSYFAQGFNDIVEVLCSGETTAGKLLMHFLLYYGEHFDAQTTAIDISGKHERHYMHQMHPYAYMSPYIHRRAPGTIDPVTGMLTVDPIVIYDPLEGAENNNVARRCFAWNSVRWTFAQSYATLSSAVERSATPPAAGGNLVPAENHHESGESKASASAASDTVGDLMDPSSPLLRCLISF